MLPGMEMMGCQNLAVSAEVMQHVVNVESSRNPYAIGVVGGQLVRQPQNLGEAVATARMLEEKGYNYSLGVAQVNRSNLGRFGLDSFEKAFAVCPNLQAGSQILAQCYASAGGDWGKAFSCYYSGNFTTGYRDGYVQRVYESIARGALAAAQPVALQAAKVPVRVVSVGKGVTGISTDAPAYRVAMRRVLDAAASGLIAEASARDVSPASRATMPTAQDSAQVDAVQVQQIVALQQQLLQARQALAQQAQGVQGMPAPQPAAGRIPTDPATAALMSHVGIIAASPLGNTAEPPTSDVFVPEVHGPGDAAKDQRPHVPPQDGSDLRQATRDDAFVF